MKIEDAVRELPPCGRDDCCCSSGIHGYDDGTTDGKAFVEGHYFRGYTFGRGIGDYGFFDEPCAVCARAAEAAHPEWGPCWPFKDEADRKLACGG